MYKTCPKFCPFGKVYCIKVVVGTQQNAQFDVFMNDSRYISNIAANFRIKIPGLFEIYCCVFLIMTQIIVMRNIVRHGFRIIKDFDQICHKEVFLVDGLCLFQLPDTLLHGGDLYLKIVWILLKHPVESFIEGFKPRYKDARSSCIFYL